ncbi:MAG: hypothetical protein M1813_009683 [Trichoglossum hirsutum]|nr:MAG: hypothetical protein M1813_009683 [Trichoglossum hirsutum]
MSTVVSQRQTRAVGLETAVPDLDHPAINLLAEYLQSTMKAPTYVSMDRKVTALLGYHWVCESGFTIPKTKLVKWSVDEIEAVKRALEYGTLKAVVEPPLHLDGKRTEFAEVLRRDRDERYWNCVNLMRYGRKRRTIPSSRRSANSESSPFQFHMDDRSNNVDGSGNRGPFLDTSSDSTTAIHARLPRRRPRDEDTDDTHNKRSRTMTQLSGNDSSSEELPGAYVSSDPAPVPLGGSASQLALPKSWATKVKSVEDEARDPNKKGANMICLTCTGTRLTLRSLRHLLTGHQELSCEIVDACLSMLVRSTHRLEAGPKTVLFESAFWRTYQKSQGHLGRWYDMVTPLKDTEMLLFPVYQDDHWTLFEVSTVEKMIRHYAPVGFNSTNVMDMAITCLKTEFEIEGLTIDQRSLPRGGSGVLTLATAAQRVLRKDVVYSQEDISGLRRLITAILLGMNMWELGGVLNSL